ncbi:MAG: ABC transporter permease subunit, partial [Micromonosporaceae bacterium]|nr:ABC transporter permease subunit [Micromonosporaceae bacterium]
MTWRQFRAQTWIATVLVAAGGALLALTVHSVAAAYRDSGLAGCSADCARAVDGFTARLQAGNLISIHDALTGLLYVCPALIGIFWGAPLIARELETGTHGLVWSQSVTRTRWLATKLVIVGGAAAASVGALSWATTAWASHIDQVGGGRLSPLLFAGRGLVPVGYALFAFMLGVTLGMVIRRTVPAMAATLAVYIGAAIAMPLWLRGHLVPAAHSTMPLNTDWVSGISVGPGGLRLVTQPHIPGAWVLASRILTPTGQPLTGAGAEQHCGSAVGSQQCFDWIGSLGLREELTLHPANHFWPLQFAESGLFLAVSVLLAAFC